MYCSDQNVKKLGFGLMRLPRRNEEIDIEQTKEMVDLFMAAGFTYFDTAWVYGGSEEATRKALVERYPRESYLLASKNAAWHNCRTREDAIAQFEGSLARTGAGYFDYYLLHNLGGDRTRLFEDFGLWDFVLRKKEEGRIRHIGFSFHSTPEELDRILTAHPETEFVQLQINYADWENPAVQSRACYETARRHGKPVIIMEPVKGGMLASPPEEAAALLKSAEPDASYASWALRFAADLPGVITVLSGMSDLGQMKDNLSVMQDFRGLTERERSVLEQARQAVVRANLISCTGCDYCAKTCPAEVGISGSFAALNELMLRNDRQQAAALAGRLVGGKGRKPASACVGCGRCEQVCPQHLEIREQLKKAAALLGS